MTPKKINGPWPKRTTVPLNNVSELLIVEECDGGIFFRVTGSYNVYSVRHTAVGTEMELEPRS